MMDSASVNTIGAIAVGSAYAGNTRVVSDSGVQTPAAARSSTNGSEATASASSAVTSDAELEKIMETPIAQANKALQAFDRQIEREIHDVTKALMYTIRDTRTNEVIAEYPPRKIQDMIAKMWELAGLFIDQKA
ncbi:MAG: flagellar protein FlaG [Chitinispirillales bacterium]|jgi:flagellar protein FlaG|nr:flagellar protein FlaG [Chitinispirillales bacterium]